MRTLSFLIAAMALGACAMTAGQHSMHYQGSDYRLLTGKKLEQLVVGSTFDYPPGEIAILGGNWERFEPGGLYVRPSDRIPFFKSSYFLNADQLCVRWSNSTIGCRRLYANERGQYLSEELPNPSGPTNTILSPVNVKRTSP
jgi:hypothetical protein